MDAGFNHSLRLDGNDEDDDLNDLEVDDVVPTESRTAPKRTTSASARFVRKAYASSSNMDAGNLWQPREKQVDQSVNLMDGDSSEDQYEKPQPKKPARPTLLSSQPTRQKSLVDIFLSDERSSRGINSRGGGGGKYGVSDMSNSDRWKSRHCRSLLFIMAVALVFTAFIMAVPQMGSLPLLSSNKGNNNKEPAVPAEEVIEEEQVQVVEEDEEPQEGGNTNNTPQFSNRLEALEYYIRDLGVSLDEDLDDQNSPSYQAVIWISQQDPANLGIPNYDLNSRRDPALAEKELLERYAMVCFYYSASGGITDNNVGLRRRHRHRHLQEGDEKDPTNEEIEMRDRFDSSWLSADGVCYWHGVSCDNDLESVTGIALQGHFLQGSLPREIFIVGAMPSLIDLNLSNNRLRGPLPDMAAGAKQVQRLGLNSLSKLKRLEFRENRFTGGLENIMELINLESLDLSKNQMTGSIPFAIKDLTSLTDMRLSDNQFDGYLGESVAAMSSLRVIYLDKNGFRGELPTGFIDFRNLEELILAENDFSGSIPTFLGELTTLTDIDLGQNGFSGSVPTELGRLTDLEEFRVPGTQLTGKMPLALCAMADAGTLLSLVSDCRTGDIFCDCCTMCV